MTVNTSDKSVFWGAVASNYFWGKRSGMVYTDWSGKSNAFKVKKWANGQNNSGSAKKHSISSGKKSSVFIGKKPVAKKGK